MLCAKVRIGLSLEVNFNFSCGYCLLNGVDELGYLLREQDARDREFAYERSMSACVRAGEMVEEALVGPRAR